ncbi:dehydrogenase E1 component subunit alpha/beta [Streptomyces sp. NPDC058953]|uniref:dehydrogenase E1 component subunit alpha/beta n=1 Tax=Streptomyces sp. NPDC058953 TaxID=3346676 RepID=UPI0036D0E8F0
MFVPADSDRALGWLRTMLVSREFDRRAALTYRQGGIWFHIPGSGHESLAVLARHLRPSDVIAPHYRDRALLLARGMTLADMAADLFATPASGSAGRNMTSHFSHRDLNVFSVAAPVASNCLPAAGFAWAARLRGDDDVVLCLVGEASTRQGEFYEAVAFAVEKQLPLVFVVEDNMYGISTRTVSGTARGLSLLTGVLVPDASDPVALDRAAARAFRQVRGGGGPVVLWCEMDRLDSHTSFDDQRVYRSAEELARLRDPITILCDRLVEEGALDRGELQQLCEEVVDEVLNAFERAARAPRPAPTSVHTHLYAAPEESPAAAPSGSPATMAAAVTDALSEALEDPDTVIFGEDIAAPKGGVFALTKGLGHAERVVNSPLAEATVVGVGVGLAAAGMRPVVELQFIDFAGPAWNQITTQLATLRWRTAGDWSCPLTVYAPSGAYTPGGGIWHSQSLESLFTHTPGLRVTVPYSPAETTAAFRLAHTGADPTMILLPKRLLRRRWADAAPVSPPGNADVTVVAWGSCRELARDAADRLAGDGVHAEVVGLWRLDPLDLGPLRQSLARTGRLVVVQEAVPTSSFGAWLVSSLVTDPDCFYQLLAAPRLVSRQPVHVPYDTGLEAHVLPSADDIVTAVHAILN